MSKIAFLGLGQMGAPMATRLLEAGHHVTVCVSPATWRALMFVISTPARP